MNRGETARLLALIAAFDRRTVGDADIHAWAIALSELAYIDCETAVHRHFRESTEYLMPAHVRQLVRTHRAEAAERRANELVKAELAAIEAAPTNAALGIRAVARELALTGGRDPDQAEEDAERGAAIRRVPCPHCRAGIGEPCVVRGWQLRGERPRRLTRWHPSREEAATGA